MKKFFAIALFSLLLLPTVALAAEFRSSESGSISVGAKETPKNLYVAGMNIDSDAKILGDLVAAGQTININGNVENDLFAAGQSIDVRGDVGKTARLVGNNIQISGKIADDLMAGGQTITIEKDSVVEGDLIAAATDLFINGKVTGNVKCAGGNVVINGEVTGNVDVKDVQTLTVADGAKIGGKLTYSSTKEGTISGGATITNGVVYNKISLTDRTKNAGGTVFSGLLISFITVLILFLLLPKWSKESVASIYSNFLHRLLWGFIALILTPVAAIILMITVLGVKIGLLLIAFYLLFLCVSSFLAPLTAGTTIFKLLNRDKKAELRLDWLTVLVGVLGLMLVALIPLVGWLVVFVFFLVSLGQVSVVAWEFLAKQRK